MYRNLGLLNCRKSYVTFVVRLEFHGPLISPQICAKFMLLRAMNFFHWIISVVRSNGTVTVK